MTIMLRCAEERDIAAITAIYRPAVIGTASNYEFEPPDEGEMAARFRSITGAGYPYYVAEVAGAVAGYAYASAYRTRPGYRYTVEDSIYVAPEWERQGVGRKLLTTLIDETARRGYRRMLAVIGDSDHVASIELHRRVGFSVAGTIPGIGWKHGRWLDGVVMQRPLGDGSDTPPEPQVR